MSSLAKQEQELFANKPSTDYSWTEPASDWDAKPPYNNITQSESGHFFEMDDTPGAERVRIQHRTGTFTETQSNGQQIVKVVGDGYEIIAGNKNVLIKGVCNITVEGDSVLHVKGDAYTKIDGDNFSSVTGKTNITSKERIDINSGGDINLYAGGAEGAVTIRAADVVNIHSDLNVSGSITTAQSVSAAKNITAGMKVGSITGVDTLGPVTSAISVFAPMVSDIGGSMMMMRMIYDTHIHPTPKGPSGTPRPLM